MANMGQLSSLAGSMPVANEKVASGLQQARQTQLQQAIAQAPAGAGPQAAQAVGAQQAQQAGQIQTAAAQQNVAQQQKLAQMGLQQQQQEAQATLNARSLAAQKQQRDMLNQLSTIDRNLKNKLFDENMSFSKDELGRTVFNERQLMDYQLSKAKSDEELRDYEQNTQQLSNRRMQMMQTSAAKIKQALEQGFDENQQKLNNDQKMRLAVAKQNLEQKIAREKARAANRAAMFGAFGTALGAVVGGAGGAAVGGGIGQMVAGTGFAKGAM